MINTRKDAKDSVGRVALLRNKAKVLVVEADFPVLRVFDLKSKKLEVIKAEDVIEVSAKTVGV